MIAAVALSTLALLASGPNDPERSRCGANHHGSCAAALSPRTPRRNRAARARSTGSGLRSRSPGVHDADWQSGRSSRLPSPSSASATAKLACRPAHRNAGQRPRLPIAAPDAQPAWRRERTCAWYAPLTTRSPSTEPGERVSASRGRGWRRHAGLRHRLDGRPARRGLTVASTRALAGNADSRRRDGVTSTPSTPRRRSTPTWRMVVYTG